jgi:hypothetical protein
MKYSDLVGDWLVGLGYTTCFFVAGGNIMHALESFRHRFAMRPTVHEVCAGIAAEYFNEVSVKGKAFALVTAGPGVTNIVTALAGAYLESRELLVIGGQVKTADLARGKVRQRGIQEIDGVAVAAPLTVASLRLDAPAPRSEWDVGDPSSLSCRWMFKLRRSTPVGSIRRPTQRSRFRHCLMQRLRKSPTDCAVRTDRPCSSEEASTGPRLTQCGADSAKSAYPYLLRGTRRIESPKIIPFTSAGPIPGVNVHRI